MARWVWWLMLLKMCELGDTVIFILRKKYKQSSFLHIYHHVTTVSLAWIACKYAPGELKSFENFSLSSWLSWLNSFQLEYFRGYVDLHYDAELRRSRYYVYLLFTRLPGTGYAEEDITVEIISDDATAGTFIHILKEWDFNKHKNVMKCYYTLIGIFDHFTKSVFISLYYLPQAKAGK